MPTTMLSVFLLGAGLLGGYLITPNHADLISERVEQVLEDSTRVAKANQVLDELSGEVDDFNEVFIDSGDSLRDLYLDHAAGSQQMQRTLEALNLEWYASQNRSVKLRERLKEFISAEEWARIFDAE